MAGWNISKKTGKFFPSVLRAGALLLLTVFLATPGPADEKKLEKAIQLIDQNNDGEALSLLQELLQENPNDPRVLHALGRIYRSRKQYKEAIELFERAVQIKPSGRGYYSLALLYEAMSVDPAGKDQEGVWLKKAQEAWSKFLGIQPQDSRKEEVARRHLEHLKVQIQELSLK